MMEETELLGNPSFFLEIFLFHNGANTAEMSEKRTVTQNFLLEVAESKFVFFTFHLINILSDFKNKQLPFRKSLDFQFLLALFFAIDTGTRPKDFDFLDLFF